MTCEFCPNHTLIIKKNKIKQLWTPKSLALGLGGRHGPKPSSVVGSPFWFLSTYLTLTREFLPGPFPLLLLLVQSPQITSPSPDFVSHLGALDVRSTLHPLPLSGSRPLSRGCWTRVLS